MRGHAQQTRTGAPAQAGDVAHGVHFHVFQPVRQRHVAKRLRPLSLLEGRSWDLCQLDDIAHQPLMLGAQCGDRPNVAFVLHHALHHVLGRFAHDVRSRC